MLAEAETIGTDGARALVSDRGEIAAVYRRSFYVRMKDGWLCAGGRGIGHGPLNMMLSFDQGPDWRALLGLGQAVTVRHHSLCIEGGPSIGLAGARPWSPPPAPRWDGESVRAGLSELDDLLDRLPLPPDGLAGFARARFRPRTLVERAAEQPIGGLSAWLAGGGQSLPVPDGLLGLGPGLTPSGDDFLAGAMGLLHAIGRGDLGTAIWEQIEPTLIRATGEISAAHLRAAATGCLAASQHDVLNALVSGDRDALDRGLRAFSFDHTSPWDGLSGVAVALRALFPVRS